MATVLVDAENVRRSAWPNVSREQLVELCRAWAGRERHRCVVVFDGRAPEEAADVVGTGSESADDWLTREAARLADADEEVWLVTSDRALRTAAGRSVKTIVGGGSFLGEIESS